MSSSHKTKYIFITGGVVSSLGKGIAAASIGLLLKSRGYRIQFQKLDPYLNVDPGTMNPYQHGEVYITADGTETDLDLGHYERFTGIETNRNSNYTAGMIYSKVISEERKGSALGQTIQVVPHITNEIKACIKKVGRPDVDIAIIEIGGTVGDIESLPFIEALRQFSLEHKQDEVIFIHLTLVPFIKAAGEIKTKPTQHSVAKLREIGVQPHILLCRTEKPFSQEIRQKLSMFCSIPVQSVIQAADVENIYQVPICFAEEKLDLQILKAFNLDAGKRKMEKWEEMLGRIATVSKVLTIAVVGKYIELQDAYKSIYEALDHAAANIGIRLKILRVSSEDLDKVRRLPAKVHGILVPGGFGVRGIEGKILSVKICREKGIPFFGICMGMQVAAIEFARNVCKLKGAHSAELDENTPHPVIDIMESQKSVKEKGGTMRLGNYPCVLSENTLAQKLYGKASVQERHRHRYEFNAKYMSEFTERGMVFSGLSPDGKLVEIMELTDHPWFVGCQFHPEFKSTVIVPHPLFTGFLTASLKSCEAKPLSE
ncbi:MAG: CTP synthase [Planctomycetes bacterium]|nr:CTP synthase [Planctomycetota bacterium]